MFCTNCGKSLAPATKFCPHCGECQPDTALPNALAQTKPVPAAPDNAAVAPGRPSISIAAPASSIPSASRGKPALWAGAAALVLATVGGAGYWGWSNKVAREEALSKIAADEVVRKTAAADAAHKLADAEQARITAEKATETAEILAAQALLDKHIAAEEAQAQAAAPGLSKPKPTVLKR